MSDEPTTEQAEELSTAVAGSPEPTESEDDGPLSRQAAKWRKRTRELEAELAAAQETITGMRRAQAEGLADAQGVKPDALWAVTSLDDLLDDGNVSPEKITAAVTAAVEKLGVAVRNTHDGLRVPGEGKVVAPPSADGRTRWDAAFKPSYQR